MHDPTIDTMQEAQHEGLTTAQDKVLSILPIPSAILSIFGSSIIIYMAVSTRRQRQWTTYTRLLLGLSICDIISSVSLAFAAFMRRPESGRVWAIGNDATCAAIGTMTQFSYSNVWYNAVLSYYFIATVRFRMKHSRIAKLLEPWMHFVSIGYPLVTAIVGASYGMYGEKATGMGCWVNEYPHGCGDGPDQEPCTSGLIGWLYLGLPLLLSGFSILINNLIIGCHVWRQSVPIKSSSLSRTVIAKSVSSSDDEIGEANKTKIRVVEERMSQHQLQRLRLVSSQAFWFVASYVICNVWLGSLGIAEAMTQEENEPQLMQNMYYMMAINAFFAPLQGFLNMLVYIRPKYLKNRQDYPLETKLWTVRRAILGERVRPHRFIFLHRNDEDKKAADSSVEQTKVEDSGTPIQSSDMVEEEGIEKSSDDEESQHSLSRVRDRRVSSIMTISVWDFDQDSEGSEELQQHSDEPARRTQRWIDKVNNGDASNAIPTIRRQSTNSLPFINELAADESEFDPAVVALDNRTTIDENDTSHSSDNDYDDIIMSNNNLSSEARWEEVSTNHGNTNGSKRASSSPNVLPLAPPKRLPSDHEPVEPVEISHDNSAERASAVPNNAVKKKKKKLSLLSHPNHLSPIVPRRVPSDYEDEDESEEVPKDHHELVANSTIKKQSSNKSPLPNQSPVPPRRIPTDYESSSSENDESAMGV